MDCLSAQRRLTGILTGVLLLTTIALGRWSDKLPSIAGWRGRAGATEFTGQSAEEPEVKNSQVGVLVR